MIENDRQLGIVRQQLAKAESALDSLRREVLPASPRMYEVMAESYVDMILSLRGDIDTYLGIAAVPENADLVMSLEGSGVGLGQTSAGVVTHFIDTFGRGLQAIVELLEPSTQQMGSSRRRPRWIEGICDLPLIGIQPGSVKILLGEPESQGLFSQENRASLQQAVDVLFRGLHWADTGTAASEAPPFGELSDAQQQALLGILTRLLPPSRGKVQQVRFQRTQRDDGITTSTAILTRESRKRIHQALADLAKDTEFKELTGVIRSVDLDKSAFELRERDDSAPDMPCEYGPDLEDVVKEYLDCRVIVSGSVETSRKTQKSKMSVDAIELNTDED